MSERPPPGLCGGCRHARLIVSARGSAFLLCQRSRTDHRFPRYPNLPVIRCVGFEAVTGPAGAADEGTHGRGEASLGEISSVE